MITVKLEECGSLRRRPCLLCGGSTGKDGVNAVVWSAVIDVSPGQTTEKRTNYVVCASCLGSDEASLRETIRVNATWHRERSEELNAIAAHLPALPAVGDWQAANGAVDFEIAFPR